MGALYRKKAARAGTELLPAILELFPILAERSDQLAGTLSGGEQQMLAIGRGLASAPDLLMLDEPSMGLAPTIVDAIFDRIQLDPSRSRPHHSAGRAARRRSAGALRPRLCAGNRTRGAGRAARHARLGCPGAARLSWNVVKHQQLNAELKERQGSQGPNRPSKRRKRHENEDILLAQEAARRPYGGIVAPAGFAAISMTAVASAAAQAREDRGDHAAVRPLGATRPTDKARRRNGHRRDQRQRRHQVDGRAPSSSWSPSTPATAPRKRRTPHSAWWRRSIRTWSVASAPGSAPSRLRSLR